MNEPEHFTIPGLPPSTNHAYRKRGNGPGMYLTDKGEAWKDLVMIHVKYQRVQPWQAWRGKYIGFTMYLHMKHPLKQDFDNCLKLTVDAVAKTLDFNDAWIVDPRTPKVWIPKDDTELIHIVIEEVAFKRGAA
jgi:crossover junction endodeoxyribonuclease RusA